MSILTLGALGWRAHSLLTATNAASNWVEHTLSVNLTLQDILTTLFDVETAERGYLLTQQASLLDAFHRAAEILPSQLEQLASLTSDNPEQQTLVTLFTSQANEFVAFLGRTGNLATGGPLTGVDLLRNMREGQSRMAALRALQARMRSNEAALLERRRANQESLRIGTELSIWGLSVVGAALVLLVLYIQRRASRNLFHAHQYLLTILQSIGDAVIATNARGIIRWMNSVAAQLTKIPAGEAQGQPLDEVFQLLDSDEREARETPVTRILREGHRVATANHRLLIRPDGTRLPIEDSGAPIRDEKGHISGVVVVFKDVSQSHALRVSEERLRIAVDSADLGIWDLDLRTNEVVWNKQLYEIFGISTDTPITRETARERTWTEDIPRMTAELDRARERATAFQVEYRIRRDRDGATRWLRVHGRYEVDERGRAVRMSGIVQDITQRRGLEQKIRNTQKLDALGTLAGGIAHDFNNLLAILRGNIQELQVESAANSAMTERVEEMSRVCERGRDLVRRILTFGRQQEQDRRVISLQPVVQETLELLRSTLPATIRLETRFACDATNALADASQIQQVLLNLAINASHAIGHGPGCLSVELRTCELSPEDVAGKAPLRAGRYVELRVADTGSGIPLEIQERIFEPFFTTKAATAGTGLGLSVVQGIIASHEGHISVYSQPGKGSQFRLLFPAVDAPAQVPAKESSVAAVGGGQRILYLDDETALVDLAQRMLSRLGYRVTGFSNPQVAVQAFAAAPDSFDLVLTDLSMPGADGIEVACQLLAIRPAIPVVLASGYVRPEDVQRAKEAGVREVIWKPATVSEMASLLNSIFEQLKVH